jgi:hypothetical protein
LPGGSWALRPSLNPLRTCRTDRAGSLRTRSDSGHHLPKGEERVGLVPSPDPWAGRITYMVRFVKLILAPAHHRHPGLDPGSGFFGSSERRRKSRLPDQARGDEGMRIV